MLYDIFKKVNPYFANSTDETKFGVFKVQNVNDYLTARGDKDGKRKPEFPDYPRQMPFNVCWFEFSTGEIDIAVLATHTDDPDKSKLVVFSRQDKALRLLYEVMIDHTEKECQKRFKFILNPYWEGMFKPVFKDYENIGEEFLGMINHINEVYVYTLLFLSCKNVHMINNVMPLKLVKANMRRGKEFTEKYYTLDIQVMKKILDIEGDAINKGVMHAFHICRGHFKTYTEDKPLMGRHAGTFFWPAHTKGSKEVGIIHKDYEVKTK